MKIFVLFLIILVSLSWAKKEKREVDVPVNIGIGPAFFLIPRGVVGKELHTGAKLDLYAVITPELMKENKNKIPKKFKNYVSTEEESHMVPLWMVIIPKYVIISPEANHSIYGGLWSIVGVSRSTHLNKSVELEGDLILPTISYLYTDAKKNDPDVQHLVGVGAMIRGGCTMRFSKKFLSTLAYGHNFNVLPIGNIYKEEGKDEQRWFQAGALSLVFHYRFDTKQKI
jgi:hypothetical protein